MDIKQNANAYAIAKASGYQKSVDDFIKEYSLYYDKIYKKLQSELGPNKIEVTQNPLRMNYNDFL